MNKTSPVINIEVKTAHKIIMTYSENAVLFSRPKF